MTQTQQGSKTLWINENRGDVACIDHGGAYLQANVQSYPRRKKHITPLGTWFRVTSTEVEVWAEDNAAHPHDEQYPLQCETCKSPPMV